MIRAFMALVVLVAGLGSARVGGAAEGVSSASLFDDFRSRSRLGYYLRLNGPALGASLRETYNFFELGPWPVYLYSSLDYSYRWTDRVSLGIELSATRDLASNVLSKWGFPVTPSTTLFHPGFKISRSSIIDNPWLNLWGQINFLPATSKFSSEYLTELFSVQFDQTWTLKTVRHPWSFGFMTRVQPFVYGTTDKREWWNLPKSLLFLSGGHYLNYAISHRFDIWTSTTFTVDRLKGSPGVFNFSPSSDDRAQVMLNYYPGVLGARVGAYVLARLREPSLASTTAGLELYLSL